MMQAMRLMNASTLTMSAVGFSESFIPNSIYTQCVRWKRKPIWLPTAKSKLFRVPKRPVKSDEENESNKRLYNHYRTYMSSLRAYMIQTQLANRKIQFDEITLKQMEEEDFQTCSAINDEWNAEVAKQREVRLSKRRNNRKDFILREITKHEEKQTKQKERIEKRVRKAKLEAPTFITAENVDTAIEECLANVVDHNRALDLQGNWHVGKYPPIEVPPAATEEIQKDSTIAEQ